MAELSEVTKQAVYRQVAVLEASIRAIDRELGEIDTRRSVLLTDRERYSTEIAALKADVPAPEVGTTSTEG